MLRFPTRLGRLGSLFAALTVMLLVAGFAASAAPRAHAEAGGHASARARALAVLHEMTLEEKVGQLFVTYVYGDRVDTTDAKDVAANREVYGVDNAEQLIDKYHLGGIIYYSWADNTNDPHQIAELSNGIQRVAMSQRVPIPMLVSTDQEGGIVARVGPPATQFPGSMALGAGRSASDAYTAARITGQELAAIGINQDYAPVSDVNVNPRNPVIGVRSFGSDPALVARMAGAQVDGYQDAGVSATAKHFPGHGDTDVDSHIALPTINHTREQWERIDLPPFKEDIERGVDAIMTAHITVPALDPTPGLPATLSKPIMTGILRKKLHYDGVIVTDALGMGGVSGHFGDDRVPVLALKAGVDMLLKPPDGKLDLQYHAVLDAVRSGEISERRINASVLRILRLKFERGLFDHPYVDTSKVDSIVGTPAHLAAAQRITDRTVTLVKNDGGTLPLSGPPGKVLVTGWGASTTRTLAADIARRGAATEAYETGINPDQATIDAAVAKAGASDLTVVTTNKAADLKGNGPGQMRLVKALVATGKPVVVVAVRDPYDIAYFTEAGIYLATYSYTDVSLESVAKVLFGEISPAGRLPVAIPEAADPDAVLYPYGFGLSYGG